MTNNTYEFDAIGTHWWCERLDGEKFSSLIQDEFEQYTAKFTQRYSRFRDDSLVAELARTRELQRPPKEMLDMLTFAQEMFEVSDGSFNLSVGACLHALGYGKRKYSGKIIQSFHDTVQFSDEKIIVPKGLMLDFGGFGKGWLIDEYAKILHKYGVNYFLINGGGDLYVQAEQPIEFALEHPYDASLKIGQTRIQDGALAASSVMKRVWKDGKTTAHHIIDPQTGEPSNTDVIATFVKAKSALIADTLATILILRPELREQLEKRYSAQIIVVTKDQISSE